MATPERASQPTLLTGAPAGAPTFVGGGEVGELHQMIAARLDAVPELLPLPGPELGERIVAAVSRSAGWALLAGCYVAAAIYWLH